MWDSETSFRNCPVNTPVYIIDNCANFYVATIVRKPYKWGHLDDFERGEVIIGDPETFYRNQLIAWAHIRGEFNETFK